MTTDNNHLIPLLDPERIRFIKKIESKKCVFDALTELLIKGQKEVTKNQVFDALIAREKLGNTSIGNGIAVPKTHLPITNPRAAALIVKRGLQLGAADKQDITFFLAIVIPEKHRNQYSIMLTTLNQKLILNGIPEKIIESKNPELLAKHFETLLYDDSHTHKATLEIN
jgi:PTS system nitrogen regulatory IIA component